MSSELIKNTRPVMTVEAVKQKARHSASVLTSLVFSGYKGLSYAADVDLVLYRVAITLLAKSILKDKTDAKRFGHVLNMEAVFIIARRDIEQEIKYIEQQG